MRAFAALAMLCLWPAAASAVTCEDRRVEGNRYTICEVDPARETLRLFLDDAGGAPYGHFSAVNAALKARGQTLIFAMNAGMYHEDRAPVGHYIEDGAERMRVIAGAGPGNFGLVPNGILCLRDGRADVIDTARYLTERPRCTHATQSGPMLVIGGQLHPRFLPDSTSRHIRNGVGTSADGRRAVFVISNNAVTFHEFGSLFRDTLRLDEALFLDGSVSRLWAPDHGRRDTGRRMGPIVGVVAPD